MGSTKGCLKVFFVLKCSLDLGFGAEGLGDRP